MGRHQRITQVTNISFVMILPGLSALIALAMISLGRVQGIHLALFATFFFLTGLGITVGYHRLATHRSFETHPAIKAVLLILGSMALEGPVVEWVANHIKHHANSDQPDDPHSPHQHGFWHGLWHAHVGWLVPYVEIDTVKYASVVMRDPVAMWVSRTFPIWVTAGYVIPFLVAGWEGLIWGGLFRQFCVQNITFAVNSVCHRFGSRPFRTGDMSTNNVFVGVLGLGEGWHNNHHAFPTSAFHGLHWWQLDISGHFIRTLATLRLAWNVKRPTLLQMQERARAASF
jgi:stearoyl-CoA desaturase (delta-9 desaturase)